MSSGDGIRLTYLCMDMIGDSSWEGDEFMRCTNLLESEVTSCVRVAEGWQALTNGGVRCRAHDDHGDDDGATGSLGSKVWCRVALQPGFV